MSFGSFNERSGQQQPMADINTTPLVDVMLVLLVIFIITAPLINQAVPIDLPKVSATELNEKPNVIMVSLNASGELSLNSISLAFVDFEGRCREAVQTRKNTELHLHADRATRYERIADIMAAAQRAGIEKIAFVTEPMQ
ncbi:biopolymer transport protein ExbD [Gammaproteobacteria bacterium]